MCKENLGCLLTEKCTNEERIRAEERTKAIQEFYDMSADVLMWLFYEYGEDLYLEVGNTLRSVKEQMEGTEVEE